VHSGVYSLSSPGEKQHKEQRSQVTKKAECACNIAESNVPSLSEVLLYFVTANFFPNLKTPVLLTTAVMSQREGFRNKPAKWVQISASPDG